MLNTERLKSTFAKYVSIDSPSLHEGKKAEILIEELRSLGCQNISVDDANESFGGESGNIYAVFPGNLPGSLLLSSHLDTVQPGIGKSAVFHSDGKITSNGGTVLGADDNAGIAEILEVLRILNEEKIPHKTIELLFPFAEELYGLGSASFDYSKLQSKEAYVLDLEGEIGTAALAAPTLISFEVQIFGKAAHAGFAPEKGVNAILAASRAIAKIRQGRIDKETTSNIGIVQGGKGMNIVSDFVKIQGEVRSLNHEKALAIIEKIKKTFKKEAEKIGAELDFTSQVQIHAYKIGEKSPAAKKFASVCRKIGLELNLTQTFGGSDFNNFALHGINGLVLACGMYKCHSTEEYSFVGDLEKSVEMILQLTMYNEQ